MATLITRISVRLKIGKNLMSASDDPLFLGLRGPCGREFRLAYAKGKSLRRGAEDLFRFAPAGDADVNVAHPELNDPTRPPIDLEGLESLYLRKGFEPIPNVRAFGEMDDRLEIEEVEITIEAEGQAKPTRFARTGPIWLGLVAGLRFEVPRAEDGA